MPEVFGKEFFSVLLGVSVIPNRGNAGLVIAGRYGRLPRPFTKPVECPILAYLR